MQDSLSRKAPVSPENSIFHLVFIASCKNAGFSIRLKVIFSWTEGDKISRYPVLCFVFLLQFMKSKESKVRKVLDFGHF